MTAIPAEGASVAMADARARLDRIWPRTLDIPRVKNPTVKQVEAFVHAGTPALFENIVSEEHIAACDPDAILERSPEARCEVFSDMPPLGPELERYSTDQVDHRTFEDYYQLLHDPNRARPCYAHEIPRSQIGLEDMKPLEELHPDLVSGGVWVGSPGVTIGLHLHKQAWVAGLHGHKDVFLVHWRYSKHLEPVPLTPNWSRTDPLNPDFEAHPDLREVVPYVGTIGPGDVLFIPDFMWHYLRPSDICVTLHPIWNRGVRVKRADSFDYRHLLAKMPWIFGWKQTAEILRQTVWHGALGRPLDYQHALPGFRVPMGAYIWNVLTTNPFDDDIDDFALQRKLSQHADVR